jgi:acetoacetate decarboxylase
MPAYPPAPWRLAGQVAVVGSPRTGAMLLLGLYGDGSTLRYGEVAGMVGPVVRHIYVDDERSIAGGREIWSLPKEAMALRWRGGRHHEVEAHDAAGALLLRARWAAPRVRFPLPTVAPFLGTLGGRHRIAWLAGALLAGPAHIELEVPERSPFATLGLAGRRLGLAGRLDVVATRPLGYSK